MRRASCERECLALLVLKAAAAVVPIPLESINGQVFYRMPFIVGIQTQLASQQELTRQQHYIGQLQLTRSAILELPLRRCRVRLFIRLSI